MHRKFTSFDELVSDLAERSGTALRFCDEESDSVQEVSCSALSDMIRSEVRCVKAECKSIELIRTGLSPETVVEIFAHVIAGCDVMLADPLVPDDLADMALKAAESSRELRETTRDELGRLPDLKSDRSEGEILFFTSGTTSRSKIVRLTSGSLCESAWSGQNMLACGPDDVLLSVLPLSHVFGFVCSLLWGLAYGAVVALGRGVRHMVDDSLFYDPTIISAVPSLTDAMLKFDTVNPGLRVVLIGAAPCRPETVSAFRDRGVAVYLGYGLTETSSGIAITQDLNEPDALYPCPGADIRIEEDGEVTVATPCMMQGYIGIEPMFDGDRFFTGDLGLIDEKGRLHLKGRKKDVLVMADGTKIFCPEYEEDLIVKTGLPDLGIIMKDGHAVLVAGSCSNSPAICEDITKKLRKEIARYNRDLQRSQQIYDVIVTAEALPRTVTGKLRRYELMEQFR